MAGLTPYAVGEVIGFAFGAGAMSYVVARFAFPQKRTAEVARLMQNAGVDEADGTRPRRSWQPPPALIGVVVAALAGLFKFAQAAPHGFSAQDLPQLRKGFLNGCVKTCSKNGAPVANCEQLCGCVLDEIAAQNPDDQHLAQWFSEAQHKGPEAMRVLTMSQERCVAREQQ